MLAILDFILYNVDNSFEICGSAIKVYEFTERPEDSYIFWAHFFIFGFKRGPEKQNAWRGLTAPHLYFKI